MGSTLLGYIIMIIGGVVMYQVLDQVLALTTWDWFFLGVGIGLWHSGWHLADDDAR